ncbi:STAS domain-containing protein [Tautonia marina]|uniref:STAS domain-containing protein n=1 Tax=Tautonia marina TaxID=2653855 RepID=UPI001260D63C|nr:STAS domain-containing protein [Tautonia marina]
MSDTTGLEDSSLEELFRSEVESHLEVLGAALLDLEQAPGDPSRVDEMMRAAHSIKGAARVVRVEAAVRVAHVMEDCFLGVQDGALTLSPTDVDVLLRGVDLLGKISEATRTPGEDLSSRFDEAVRSFVLEVNAILASRGRPLTTPSGLASSPPREAVAADVPAPDPPLVMPPAEATTMPVATTIAFPGYLDAGAAEEIRLRFLSAVGRGCDAVRLDLRATKDLDVQGLALLAALPRHVARHGRPRLRMAGVSAEMEAVLRVTGLGGAFDLRGVQAPRDS